MRQTLTLGITLLAAGWACSGDADVSTEHPAAPSSDQAEPAAHLVPTSAEPTPAASSDPAEPETQPADAPEAGRTVSVTSVNVEPGQWAGCSVSLTRGVFCEEHQHNDGPCVELLRADLAPAPGTERLLGCGHTVGCEHAADAHPVVVVATDSEPLVAIGTSEDMSCGSEVTVRGDSFLLVGGGEDGVYRQRYRWRRGAFRVVSARFRPASY